MNNDVKQIKGKVTLLVKNTSKKFVENIEELIEKEEYGAALNKLDSINPENLSESNNQIAIFLKVKIFYFKGKSLFVFRKVISKVRIDG